MLLHRAGPRRGARRSDEAELAAKGEQDVPPVEPDRQVKRHRGGDEGEREEERGCQVCHSFIPFFIHSLTKLFCFGCVRYL